MNPKTIIDSIEQNRTVMEAGLKRMSGQVQPLQRQALDGKDAASLLRQLSGIQLAGAAEALYQFSEAESEIRHAIQIITAPEDANIIEGEAVIIQEEIQS